jgi:hypothetical protein
MAGERLKSAYTSTPIQGRVVLLTQEADEPSVTENKTPTQTPRANQKRRFLEHADRIDAKFDDLVLTIFHDQSAFISKRTEQGLAAYPEIFSVCTNLRPLKNHKEACSREERLKVVPQAKHFLFVQGPDDMKKAYPIALEKTMKDWAHQLETLPPIVDPRCTPEGFWPSFAPINPPPEGPHKKARAILEEAWKYWMISQNISNAMLHIYGVTADEDSQRQGVVISVGFNERFVQKGLEKEAKNYIRNILNSPEFPLQSRDWFTQVANSKEQNTRLSEGKLFFAISEKDLSHSAHMKMFAHTFISNIQSS